MIYIFPGIKHVEESRYYNSNKDCYSYEKPKDWEFMKQSGEVLKNIPDTWKTYPDTDAGKMSIIDMEYNELKMTKDTESTCHELIHLASACLYLWRKLKGINM